MNTNSKAIVLSRLNAINRRLDGAIDAHKCDPKKTSAQRADSRKVFMENIAGVQSDLTALYVDINAQVKEECEVLPQLNRTMLDATINQARRKVLERFGNFPIAAALIEMFVMFLESQITLNCNILAIKAEGMADDRRGPNSQFYKIDGEPKNP